MSRKAAQNLRPSGHGWKNATTPSQPSPTLSTPTTAGTNAGWKSLNSLTTMQRPIPPVAENDGFETVQNRRSSNANRHFAKPQSNLNPSWRSNASVSPPSIAATARSSVYHASKKPGSIYKESCMPTADRDPALMEAQNSRGAKISKASYRPGMLIRAAMHEPDLNHGGASSSTVTVADRYRSETKFGPIHTKVRKAIVIALYQDHYLAVPLYTHNGTGLLKKLKPDEFVSVCDHRKKGKFQKLSKHLPLMTEHLNGDINPYHEKSTAHITYPISRRYDLPVVHEGHLDAPSIQHLINLFNEYAPRLAKL